MIQVYKLKDNFGKIFYVKDAFQESLSQILFHSIYLKKYSCANISEINMNIRRNFKKYINVHKRPKPIFFNSNIATVMQNFKLF